MRAYSEPLVPQITWPDVQYIFKQQLIKLHEQTKDDAADWTKVDMLSEQEGGDNNFKVRQLDVVFDII